MQYSFQVKFGRKSSKRANVPEEITFYLLHLSLMRDYLELEFGAVKECMKTFPFNVENIIDDWVNHIFINVLIFYDEF